MARQQAFLASMANKAISAGTLVNPKRLISFLNAATKSLTTDPELASLKNLAGLANELHGIGLDQIQFLTVPWEWWVEDRNRVVWSADADRLWRRIRHDEPLTRKQAQDVTTAADAPTGSAKPKPTPSDDATPDEDPSASPGTVRSPTPSAKSKAERAAENGLCA
jgi:anionic cell wall polymer biosynthesis LytR-Cps2A-Psr (LCP) family protein